MQHSVVKLILAGILPILGLVISPNLASAKGSSTLAEKSVVERSLSSKKRNKWQNKKKRQRKVRSRLAKKLKRKAKVKHKKFGFLGFRPVLGGTFFTLQGSDSDFFQVDGTNSINLDYVPGITAGVQADIGFGSSKFVFETGLLYMETGGKKENVPLANDPTRFVSVDYRFQYIAIPLNAKYYFTRVHQSSMYVRFGLIPAFFSGLDANINIDGDGHTDDSAGGIRDMDVLINMGLGGQYKINHKTSLFLEGNFYRGLVNLSEIGNTFNQGFGILGGFSINL